MKVRHCSMVVALLLAGAPFRVHAATPRTFDAGSLIIPMDLAYQDKGMFQAYGLVFQLLRQGIPVAWVIDPAKTWHASPCNAAGDSCAWDCTVEGSGQKCAYPTASPDFFAATKVLWDDQGKLAAGAAISSHGYRGGPFVIDVANREAALAIVNAWNDPSLWTANPWAKRTVFQTVSVHEATASFQGVVAKEMFAAPTIAVFSDGNEAIATSYLRAAGIPQSSGTEFPAAKCGAGTCGPGTTNPDMLTVQSIMGDMGTCDALNGNHKNGALFNADGLPAYCQIMSMHWNVTDRETVQCDGGACPATQAQCTGKKITYHGHEVVAEVRAFLQYPTHFFAECQAVNAYENTAPNPAWPFLDDSGRDGHFLTTRGQPPACPCTDADFVCVAGGCGGVDCCLPKDVKEQGAGYMIAAQPATNTLKVLRPSVAYNQQDGTFATVGGSEPAYNLSSYLGTKYKNDREVTFITGPSGPGNQDVWMTGYVDGLCDIGCQPGQEFCTAPACTAAGKVSYLGGHQYSTTVPVSSNGSSQGTRLFLNALFEADCVTRSGQPAIELSLIGNQVVAAKSVPVTRTYQLSYSNTGAGAALSAALHLSVAGVAGVSEVGQGGVIASPGASWDIGSISGVPTPVGDPASSGTRSVTLSFSSWGEATLTVGLGYTVGASAMEAPARVFTVRVLPDSDGDGVPDESDAAPNDANRCGDQDKDTCDDCSQGTFNPRQDGPDSDGDGICDAGDTDNGTDGGTQTGTGRHLDTGCLCLVGNPPAWSAFGLGGLGLAVLLVLRRSRRR